MTSHYSLEYCFFCCCACSHFVCPCSLQLARVATLVEDQEVSLSLSSSYHYYTDNYYAYYEKQQNVQEHGSIILTPAVIQLRFDITHLSHNEEGNVAQQQ